MAARLVDPLHSSVAGIAPNVLIISGFPWYTSEHAVHRYLIDIYPAAAPVTTRLYTNPTNGASRGHCFVEYALPVSAAGPASSSSSMYAGAVPSATTSGNTADAHKTLPDGHSGGTTDDPLDALLPPVLREVRRRVEEQPYECGPLQVHAYVLTSQRWSRAGRLPELPLDPPPARWRGRTGVLVGYGDEGTAVRGGHELGLPNTVTAEGQEQLERLRKRLRTGSARRGVAHASSE